MKHTRKSSRILSAVLAGLMLLAAAPLSALAANATGPKIQLGTSSSTLYDIALDAAPLDIQDSAYTIKGDATVLELGLMGQANEWTQYVVVSDVKAVDVTLDGFTGGQYLIFKDSDAVTINVASASKVQNIVADNSAVTIKNADLLDYTPTKLNNGTITEDGSTPAHSYTVAFLRDKQVITSANVGDTVYVSLRDNDVEVTNQPKFTWYHDEVGSDYVIQKDTATLTIAEAQAGQTLIAVATVEGKEVRGDLKVADNAVSAYTVKFFEGTQPIIGTEVGRIVRASVYEGENAVANQPTFTWYHDAIRTEYQINSDVTADSITVADAQYGQTLIAVATYNNEDVQGALKVAGASSGGGGGGGGGGGSANGSSNVTVNVPTSVTNGKATATINNATIKNAISKVKDGETVEIKVATGNANTMDVKLAASALQALADSKAGSVKISSPIGDVTLSTDVLKAIIAAAGGKDVTLSFGKATSLSDTQKETVGDRPAYDISIKAGDSYITNFDGESIEIALPYAKKANESDNGIVVLFVNNEGATERMSTSYSDGKANFTTTHLSVYMIAYDPAAAWENPFNDVSENDWFYEAVRYAVMNNLFNGTSTTAFSPNAQMTRGMLVTVLHRQEGTPAAGSNPFTDVPAGQYYSDAVAWAASNNIVQGMGNNTFAPNANVTREQMAVILMGYAKMKGENVTTGGTISGFSDGTKVASWAKDAMAWAISEGIIKGDSNGLLNPQGNATRAETATMLMRYLEK